MVWFVWEMLPPPVFEKEPCLAVPHSELLRMVPIPGMAFSAESTPSTGNCLSFLWAFWSFFGWLIGWFCFVLFCIFSETFFVFKGDPNSCFAARHWVNVHYGSTTCTQVSRTKSWDLIHYRAHPVHVNTLNGFKEFHGLLFKLLT